MLARTPHQRRVMRAINNNLLRQDHINQMDLPYGAHCRAWATHWLDHQLSQLLELLPEVPNA
jgi:hypothetical protein